jgi:hypothetical protein
VQTAPLLGQEDNTRLYYNINPSLPRPGSILNPGNLVILILFQMESMRKQIYTYEIGIFLFPKTNYFQK